MVVPSALIFTLLGAPAAVYAAPVLDPPSLVERAPAPANTNVNPAAVTGGVTCTDPGTTLVSHDINVAVLSICGGIAGSIQFCGGNPETTTGASGTAKFTLTATDPGATINVSKGRWEGCVRAAQAVCGNSPFKTTCVGGASTGNVAFTLSANK